MSVVIRCCVSMSWENVYFHQPGASGPIDTLITSFYLFTWF